METDGHNIVACDDVNVFVKKEPLDIDDIKGEPEPDEYLSQESTIISLDVPVEHHVKEEPTSDIYTNNDMFIKDESIEFEENFSSNDPRILVGASKVENEAHSKMEEDLVSSCEDMDSLTGFDDVEEKNSCGDSNNQQIHDDQNMHNDDFNKVADKPIEKERFQCQYCDKSYSSKCTLLRHLISHNPYELQCKVCKEIIGSRKELTSHMITHSDNANKCFKCQFCQKLFRSKQGWKAHETTHTGKPYKCGTCEKLFASASGLKRHERIHTKETPNITIYIKANNKSAESQSADGSTKSSEKVAAIKSDEKESLDDEESLRCCGIKFSSTKTLEVHQWLHGAKGRGEDGLFKCQYCEAAFTRKDKKKAHERKHTLEKPYKCQFCDLNFRTTANRVLHENLRCNIGNPFKCRICKKGYAELTLLKAHEYMHKKDSNEVS